MAPEERERERLRHATDNPEKLFVAVEGGARGFHIKLFQGKISFGMYVPFGSLESVEDRRLSVREAMDTCYQLIDNNILSKLNDCSKDERIIISLGHPGDWVNIYTYSEEALIEGDPKLRFDLYENYPARQGYLSIDADIGNFEDWRRELKSLGSR
ncbi:MAG: hypothetical protein LBB18_01005 [Puniceicoccales bacterium]|nr:hypothetical protein [Puniceicoccales bacterium]